MESKKSFLKFFKEDVIGTENRFLFYSWCGALVLILAIGFVLSSQSLTMLGVADSREFQVNFDNPVEIKRIYVLPGQIVKKGELLIELNQTELDLQVRTLKARFDRLQAEIQLRNEISQLTKEQKNLPLGSDPLQTEILDTKREMEILEKRAKNLFVFAEVDGTVGAVNFKDGEKAPSFAPLLTLLPLQPSFVNGYVNETFQSSVEVGQHVQVASTSGKVVQGTVVSVGARIVPIPQRLLRIQTIPAWGREVVIKIPQTNQFLLGEKVSVHKNWEIKFFSTAQANADEGLPVTHDPRVIPEEVKYPSSITDLFHPEISGLVFLPELKQFAMISDDYPDNRPLILLMNEKGEVQEHMIEIQGLEKMEDIESISASGKNIYLLSSLSANKKGQLKKPRQVMAKIEYNGMQFALSKKVNLRGMLLEAMNASKDPLLNEIARHSSGNEVDDLEVEGHVLHGDELYLLLKRPILHRNEGILLKVSSFEKIFETEKINPEELQVAARFAMNLPDHEDVDVLLTDLVSDGKNFYMASSCHGEKCSAVWKLPVGANKAELLQEFKLRHLEGLAFHPVSHDLFGVFDSKKIGGKYFVIPGGTR